MAFYTFVDRVGSKIYHRYIDNEGNRKQEVVTEFPIELFIKGRGENRDLYGTPLHKLEYDNCRDALNFIRQNDKNGVPIYGQKSLAHQFISKRYPGLITPDFDRLRILNFDLEVRHDGYDDVDLVTVRNSSGETSQITVGDAKARATASERWEVWDVYNEKWYYLADEFCPIFRPGGFPEAKDADYEIISISAKLIGRDKKFTFGMKDYTPKSENSVYKKFDSEQDMLNGFVNFIRVLRPDILTGYNIESFDIPYLINRLRKVCGASIADSLSPFYGQARRCISEYNIGTRDAPETGYRILGINVFDFMLLYQKYNPEKQESYRLDNIAFIELGERKTDYSEYDNSLMRLYKENFDLFVDYNERDVELVERLDNKKQFLLLALLVVLMTKSRYQELMGAVRLWDNLIYNMLLEDGVVIPPEKRSHSSRILGAYVKDPIPAKYGWGASMDLTSLYPSICMMLNMSPDTKVRDEQGTIDLVERLLEGDDLAKEAREKGWSMAANGSAYHNDFKGVLPRGMEYVFNQRKHYKDLMLEAEKEKTKLEREKAPAAQISQISSKIAALDATQLAMKILANSGYGVSANAGFRYFDSHIAQGITLTGQYIIRYIGNEINAFLNKEFGTNRDYIITSDTDSCYIDLDTVPSDPTNVEKSLDEIDSFVDTKLTPAVDNAFSILAERLGATENRLDMKREAIYRNAIWRRKKHYVLEVFDNEHVRYTEPVIKMMGIETARSDKPMIVRDELETCLRIMLTGTEKQLQTEVEKFKEVFYNSPFDVIATPKGVNDIEKWLVDGNKWKPGAPGHVRAAIVHNNVVAERDLSRHVRRIRSGDKLKLMPLKEVNPYRVNAVAFIDELSPELGFEEWLSVDAQWEAAFMKPLRSFTDILDWEPVRRNTLTSLFG